ncbi:MAG: hypothetical protein ACOC8X_01395 [Chloroflexota bacterium]
MFVLPSLFFIGRLGGYLAIVVYVLMAPLLFIMWRRYLMGAFATISSRRVLLLALLGFSLLLLFFLVIYPLADAGVVGGGSDRDDALNLAASRLVQGQYPYSVRTYLDNPISPLPGAVLLSLPFVLLGTSAYQNLFWLAIFFVVAARSTRNWGVGLTVLAALLFLAPVSVSAIANGSDLLSNGIYVFVFTWLLLRDDHSFSSRLLAAVLLGLGLSSRATFWLLAPPLLAHLWRRVSAQQALAALLVLGGTFTLVTVPFYLAAPEQFSPLHTASRIEELGLGSPAVWLIPLLSVAGSLLIALVVWRRNGERIYHQMTLALALPVLLSLAAALIQFGDIYWRLVAYGSGYLAFGAYALLAARAAEGASSRTSQLTTTR